MKKRILSILTALCLCLTLLPTAALAGGETVINSSYIWSTADVDSNTYYTLTPGSYKLDTDVTLDKPLLIAQGTSGGTVTLDLNGYTLTANVSVGTEDPSGYLTIQDTSEFGSGILTSDSGTTLTIKAGQVTLESGTVNCGSASDDTAVTVTGSGSSTLNAHGGLVDGAVSVVGSISDNYPVTTEDTDKTHTVFTGPVTVGESASSTGVITAGIYNGTVTVKNGGNVKAGTFNNTVTVESDGCVARGAEIDITNNGVLIFKDGSKFGDTVVGSVVGTNDFPTLLTPLAEKFSGTGYVEVQTTSGSITSTYYSTTGTELTKPTGLTDGNLAVTDNGSDPIEVTLTNCVIPGKLILPETKNVTIKISGTVVVNHIVAGTDSDDKAGTIIIEGANNGGDKLYGNGTMKLDSGKLTIKGLSVEYGSISTQTDEALTLDSADVILNGGLDYMNDATAGSSPDGSSPELKYGLMLHSSNLTVKNGYYQNGTQLFQAVSLWAEMIVLDDSSTLTLDGVYITNYDNINHDQAAILDGNLKKLKDFLPEGYRISMIGEFNTSNTDGTYSIDGWTIVDPTDKPATDLTLQKHCTVTFNANGGTFSSDATGGTFSDDRTTMTQRVPYGTTVTPTVPTRSGHTFVKWLDADGNAYGFNTAVTQNIILTAQWTLNSGTPSTSGATYHTITATAGTGGSISPSGAVSVRRGNDKTFTVSPVQGYVLSDLLVDGQSVGALTSYTFANVKTSHTIKAVFEPDTANSADRPVGLNSTDHVAYIQGYADGTFRPNANITRAQTAVLLYRLLTPERLAGIETDTHSFTDITASDWYSHEVATMANGGYITGYADGRFGGNDSITRAQFVTILTRFLGQRDVDCDLSDVPESHWAYNAIATAVDAGWISGYADGTFRPDQPITRAQVVTILNRALDRGIDADSALTASYKTFLDNPATAWHYYDILEAANGHDYTGHRPSENWTRLK